MNKSRVLLEIGLVLAALLIAVIITLIAKQEDMATIQFSVAVEPINAPPNVSIEILPARIPVNVSYPRTELLVVEAKDFVIPIDIQSLFETSRGVVAIDPRTWIYDDDEIARAQKTRLSPDDVRFVDDSRKQGSVRVTAIDPDVVITVSATLISEMFPIRARISGKPAENFVVEQLGGIRVTPSEVLITAEEHWRMKYMEESYEIETETIDLAGRTEPFREIVRLQLPDELQLVNESNLSVEVQVSIVEGEIEREIENVPITIFVVDPALRAQIEPKSVNITASGIHSLLELLDFSSFVFKPKRSYSEPVGEKIQVELDILLAPTLSSEIREGVKLVAPKTITVEVEYVKKEAVRNFD